MIIKLPNLFIITTVCSNYVLWISQHSTLNTFKMLLIQMRDSNIFLYRYSLLLIIDLLFISIFHVCKFIIYISRVIQRDLTIINCSIRSFVNFLHFLGRPSYLLNIKWMFVNGFLLCQLYSFNLNISPLILLLLLLFQLFCQLTAK